MSISKGKSERSPNFRFIREGDAFLDRIVTGYDTWMRSYVPLLNRESAENTDNRQNCICGKYIALISIDIWLQLWERNAVTVIRITSLHCVCPSLVKVEFVSFLYGRWKSKLNSVPICHGCIVWMESFTELNKGEICFSVILRQKKSISMEKPHPLSFCTCVEWVPHNQTHWYVQKSYISTCFSWRYIDENVKS